MQRSVLLIAIFAAGFCGMVAEYSVSTVVGYLSGNAVAAYSVLISTFMFAMGFGAVLSRMLPEGELPAFFRVECALSVVVAASAVFIAQAARLELTWEAGIFSALLVGGLIGLEIPLLMRINEKRDIILRDNAALVFGADYFGSFAAGLVFSTVLLPHLGLVGTPVLCGAINLAIAGLVLVAFRTELRLVALAPFVLASAAVGWIALNGEAIVFSAEQAQYEDPIVLRQQTPYQSIVITSVKASIGGEEDVCLYLNGQTQFCTVDEARYHESLVHPAFAVMPTAKRVLILGGGDGLAAREVLKYPATTITLVDLDPDMVELCRTEPLITAANHGSLDNPKLTYVPGDAFTWVAKSGEQWDVIIVDLPDPEGPALAKLYSLEFYTMLRDRLAPSGVIVAQSTSPIHATKAFGTIVTTMQAAGLTTVPYRANVPTFGDWGFTLAVRQAFMDESQVRSRLDAFEPAVPTRHLNRDAMQAATRFEKGILPDPDTTPVSRLMRPTVNLAYAEAYERID